MKCPQKGGAFQFDLPASGSGATPDFVRLRVSTASGEVIAQSPNPIQPNASGVVYFSLPLDSLADGLYEVAIEEEGSQDPPTIYRFSVSCPR